MIPLELLTSLNFNFTDGTSALIGTVTAFIRLSSEYPDYGEILEANVCVLSYCAQKRNVSITLDRFSSTILETHHGTWAVDEVDDPNIVVPVNALSFIGDGFKVTFPPLLTKTNDTGGDDYSDAEGPPLWQLSLQDLMGSFEGELALYSTVGLRTDGRERFEVTSDIIRAFRSSPNISMTMDNIATVLTNFIRDSSNMTIIGQAGESQIYVHEIWLWIILPASLVLGATLFLMLTMLQTKRRGARNLEEFRAVAFVSRIARFGSRHALTSSNKRDGAGRRPRKFGFRWRKRQVVNGYCIERRRSRI